MDSAQSSYAFTGMEPLPVAEDDDELVTVGENWADVVAVRVAGPLTLHVEHEDGVHGEVRFLPSHLRGVFEVLKDPAYFARVGIRHGAVSWPDEMPDLAPDNMYIHLKRDGVWILN